MGLATAADLVRRGYSDVRLCDVDEQAVQALASAGGIQYEGLFGSGFARVTLATRSHAHAVAGANVILVSTLAGHQAQVAVALAPVLVDDQVVILHQGCTGGAFLFAQELRRHDCTAHIHLAETVNTVYLCGRQGLTSVFVKGVKAWLEITSFPAGSEEQILSRLDGTFPSFAPGTNSLETGLNNPNPMVHVPSYLGNLGLVGATSEAAQGTLYLGEIISEPVDRLVHLLDAERLAVMAALGLRAISYDDFGTRCYPPGASMTSGVPRFGPKLLPRFIEEDVPAGLVPIASLAAKVGINVPITRLLIDLASTLWKVDFVQTGRNLRCFGLADLDAEGVVAAFAG
jgi:opine dehydrogenase